MLNDDEEQQVIICTTYLVYYYLMYSLEGGQFQWTEIGDDGATALADLRVIKNFTTLK